MGHLRHFKQFPDKPTRRGLRVLRKLNAGWHKRWEILAAGARFDPSSGFYRTPGGNRMSYSPDSPDAMDVGTLDLIVSIAPTEDNPW